MSAGSVRAGGAFVEIYAKNSKFLSGVAQVQAKLKAVGSAMRALGQSMTMAGAALGAPLVAAATVASKFEDQMLGMAASAGLTAAEMKVVGDAAIELSKRLGISPARVAEAFQELIKAGMPVAEVLNGAGEAAIQFAKVSGVSANEAAVFMKVAMNTFKVSAIEAVDTLSAAADASETSIAKMVESFGLVGSAGALFNQSLFDVSQGLAVLARYGISGEEAGTGIKTMLMRLTSPTTEASSALEGLGLSVESFRGADGNLMPLVQIVGVLEKAMVGVDKVMRDQILGDVFGDRGIRVVGAFLDYGTAGFETMKESMESNLPVSAKFQILMAGISGAMEKMWAAVERLSISIAKSFGDAIGKFATIVAKALDAVGAFVEQFPQIAQYAAVAAGSLVALGVAVMALGIGFNVASAAVGVFGAAIALLTSPIGIVVAVFAAGVATILTNLYQISPAFAEECDGIMAALYAMDFKGAWELMNIDLAIALVKFRQYWHDEIEFLKNTFSAVWDYVYDAFAEAFDRILGAFGTDIIWMQGQFEKLGLYIKAAFDWSFLSDGLTEALDKVDARVEQEREKAGDADARSAERTQKRKERGDERQKASDELKDSYEGTIRALEDERDSIKDANKKRREAADQKKRDSEAKAGVQQVDPMAIPEPAGEAKTGKTLSTFSAALSGRMGIGPELNYSMETASNTARIAVATEQMLAQLMQGDFKNFPVLAAGQNAINNLAKPAAQALSDSPLGQLDIVQRTAKAAEDTVGLLRQVLREVRDGGLEFM